MGKPRDLSWPGGWLPSNHCLGLFLAAAAAAARCSWRLWALRMFLSCSRAGKNGRIQTKHLQAHFRHGHAQFHWLHPSHFEKPSLPASGNLHLGSPNLIFGLRAGDPFDESSAKTKFLKKELLGFYLWRYFIWWWELEDEYIFTFNSAL